MTAAGTKGARVSVEAEHLHACCVVARELAPGQEEALAAMAAAVDAST